MIAQLSQNWMPAILGCMIWVPIGALIMMIGGWLIQGDLEPMIGIPGIFSAIALGYFTARPPTPELAPVFFVGITATIVLIPFFKWVSNKIAFVRLDEESAARAYDQLAKTSGNSLAKFKLAALMHERGFSATAVELGHEALMQAPRATFSEEQREIARWALSAYETAKPIRCLDCGFENGTTSIWCDKCGGRLLMPYIGNRLYGEKTVKRILAVWLMLVVGIAVVPATRFAVPSQWVMPAILSEIALIVFVAVRAFVGGESSGATS